MKKILCLITFGLFIFLHSSTFAKNYIMLEYYNYIDNSACFEEYAGDHSRKYHFDRELEEYEISLIERIEGVNSVYAHGGRYQLLVYKGKMFNWRTIHSNILNITGVVCSDCQ